MLYNTRKSVSFLLAAVICLSMFSPAAFAESSENTAADVSSLETAVVETAAPVADDPSESEESLSSETADIGAAEASEDLSSGAEEPSLSLSGEAVSESQTSESEGNTSDVPAADASVSQDTQTEEEQASSGTASEIVSPETSVQEDAPAAVVSDEAEAVSSPEPAEEIEEPKTVRVVFSCSETADLSGLSVYNSQNQLADPFYDEAAASYSYGTYDLEAGDYTYSLYDLSGQYEDLESVPFTVSEDDTELSVLITLTAVEEDPFAGLELHSITVVNPLYSDVVSESDIPAVDITLEECKELLEQENSPSVSAPASGGLMLFSSAKSAFRASSSAAYSSIFFTDVSSAGASLKTSLTARQEEVKIYFQSSSQQDWSSLCTSIYASAVLHTGVSTEGDYLRYEYGGYNATGTGPVVLSGTDVYSYQFIYKPLYYTTAEQEDAMTDAVSSVLGQLALSGKTGYEKIKAIYDYLTANVTYDYANLNNDSYVLKYTGYAALVNRTAICQGYAAAFYRLCLESGVDARIISSDAMCHAWNIAYLDGSYYALDATWDAGKTSYSWFLKGSSSWLSSHTMNGVCTIGDQYSSSSFSASYPLPEQDYSASEEEEAAEATPTPSPTETPAVQETASVRVYHAPADATCTESGSLAYWEDTESGLLFLSEDATDPVSPEDLVIAPLGHSYENGVCVRCGDVSYYSISYELNGGTNAEGNPSAYEPDTGVTLLAPVRTGYLFEGWFENSSFTGSSVAEIPAGSAGSLTLYAKWSPIRYSIVFDGNGSTAGVMRSLTSVTYDRTVTLTSNAFRRTGYTFLGWSLRADSTEADFVNRAAVSNLTESGGSTVTLYAVWTPIAYTVVFDPNGGSGSMSAESGLCRYDIVYALPSCGFSRTGYRFVGWSLRSTGTAVYSDGQTISNLASVDGKVITLYAVWAAYEYEIVFDGNGATSGVMRAMTGRKCGTVYTLTSNSFRKTGYTFTGWNTMPDGTGTAYVNRARQADFAVEDGATVTLYAQWGPVSYKIYYRNVLATDSNPNPESFTADDGTIVLAPLSRPGYVFLGWYADAGFRTYLASIETEGGGNRTVYAKWAAYSYTIVFDANGGTGSMNSLTNRLCSRTYTLTTNTFKRIGYVFTGWNTQPDGTGSGYANRARVTALSTENNDIVTLYAQWALTPYKITYRNVLSSDYNPNPSSYVYGQSFALEDLSRAGYEFDGWYAEASFRNRITVFNEDLTGSRNITVYAKWTVLKYNIAFDSNTLGRGTATGTMRTLTNRLCGRTYTLTSNTYRMAGYTFLGWSTDPNDEVPMFANRARVTDLSTVNGDTVTLYAIWQLNALRSSY